MVTEQQARADYLHWIEVINSRDLDLIDRTTDELLAHDYVWHHPAVANPREGPEGVKRFIRRVFEGNPGFRITVEDLLAEGDKLAARWTIRRTHPQSGKPQRIANIQILRYAGGKFTESWELVGPWEDDV